MSSMKTSRRFLLPAWHKWNSSFVFSRFPRSSTKSSSSLLSISSMSLSSSSSSSSYLRQHCVASSKCLHRLNANSIRQSSQHTLFRNQQSCTVFDCKLINHSHFKSCQRFHEDQSVPQYKKAQSSLSIRPYSNANTNTNTKFELVEKEASLILRRGDHESTCLPFIWLRDHCRCPSCYNHDTHQKNYVDSTLSHAGTEKLVIDNIALEDGGSSLVIHWKDDHISQYSVDWLMANSYNENNNVATSTVKRVLWTGDTIRDGGGPPSVSFASHVESEEGLHQTIRNLLEYGFTQITEAPASLEGIKTATDRLSPIQDTFYGAMWEFTSNGSFSDTAFTTNFLAAHTDTTYCGEPAGIQVFQCLGHDGVGGETLLVDGFRAIDSLRQTHPQAVRCLSTHSVPHEYKESPSSAGASTGGGGGSPGYHLYALCPVIGLHPNTGDILHLRFNPYDRAPLNTIPPENVSEFYRSYHLLSARITDPEGEFWTKLWPGTILLIDNWRVMHGRAAFDGKRIMSGCYLRRDDLMSKMRVMGLKTGL